jgi:two-component sensor histidine kinase
MRIVFFNCLIVLSLCFQSFSVSANSTKKEGLELALQLFCNEQMNATKIKQFDPKISEIRIIKKLISNKKCSYKELKTLSTRIILLYRNNPNHLTWFDKKYIILPSQTKTVNLDYVVMMKNIIIAFSNQNHNDIANLYQKKLLTYVNSIQTKDDDYKRAKIHLSHYDAILNTIKDDGKQILKIASKNEKIATELKDTALIIESKFLSLGYYLFENKLEEYIQVSEECLRLENLSKKKSEVYFANILNLVDAYIYAGNHEEQAFELLKTIHQSPEYSIESYAYFSKFLAYINPNSVYKKQAFDYLKINSIQDYLSKTDSLCKQNLYPNDYYHYLKETALALNNFGESKMAVNVMRTTVNVIKEIYTKDLSDSYIQNEKNKIEIKKNSEINKQKEIEVLYIISLSIISVLLIVIFSFYRKNKQNKILNKQNELIKTKEQENEILVKELHHRVKNNFQIISSLLYEQQKNTSNQEFNSILSDIKARIMSMALTHEKLYVNENFYLLENYVKSLFTDLQTIFRDSNAQLKSSFPEEIRINVDNALPIGLILNELMTNSLKHSCPNNDEMTLFINVKKGANTIQITYSDSGNKMTQDLYDNSTSMGLKLVKRLTKQLQGEIEFQEHLLILSFPVD